MNRVAFWTDTLKRMRDIIQSYKPFTECGHEDQWQMVMIDLVVAERHLADLAQAPDADAVDIAEWRLNERVNTLDRRMQALFDATQSATRH